MGSGLPDPGFRGYFGAIFSSSFGHISESIRDTGLGQKTQASIFSVLSDQEKRQFKKCIFWDLGPKMGPKFTRNTPRDTLSGP